MSAQAEHGEGDEWLGGGESVGDAGDEPDFSVHRFDAAVGHVVLDGGQDAAAVSGDPAGQVRKQWDAGGLECPRFCGLEIKTQARLDV